MGQSNMVGRDTSTLAGQVDDPRILAFTAENEWVVAREPITPQVGNIAVGMGPGISFAGAMRKADAGRAVGLVGCAVGGTPLRRWVKGGDLYEAAVARAKRAAIERRPVPEPSGTPGTSGADIRMTRLRVPDAPKKQATVLGHGADAVPALVDVLDVFRRYGINLTNIDTRPSQKRNFEYYFFTDLVGHMEDENVKAALAEAKGHCSQLAVLGSFPRAVETL